MMYMYKLTLAPDFCPATSQALSKRSSEKLNFHLVRPINSKFQKSHCYIGKKLWNELTASEQNAPDIDTFKRLLKARLLDSEMALYRLPDIHQSPPGN